MLTSLRLKDWKSFGDGPAMPFGPLTLLVGPNGSGKSNVIDALRFLQGVALDLPIGEVLRGRYAGQREIWPGIRGQLVEAGRGGREQIDIKSVWTAPSATYELGIDTANDGSIVTERLGPQPSGFEAHRGRITYRGSDGAPHILTLDWRVTALDQLSVFLPQSTIVRARAVAHMMRETVFLDVQPARMRDYKNESAEQLGVNAENVSSVLYRLSEGTELQNIVDWLSELCAPAIEAIAFDRTQLGDVMMFLVEENGTRVSARSISDGTLRFLGMVVALLTIPEGSMIVVEEPDVGLHPSRVHLLASLLEDMVKRRSLQVIATTHSPTLLSHLSPEALSNVIAFGRDLDDGTTVGRRIGDLPHFETLQKSNELEHLVSTGWLERAL